MRTLQLCVRTIVSHLAKQDWILQACIEASVEDKEIALPTGLQEAWVLREKQMEIAKSINVRPESITPTALVEHYNKSIDFGVTKKCDSRPVSCLQAVIQHFLDVLAILNQLGIMQLKHGKGCLIWSPCVLEAFEQSIIDKSLKMKVLIGIGVYLD